MKPEDYIPLEGRLRGPLFSSRLYMGSDHLLKSTIAGIHENYRRFAWEDIQAFTIQKTGWYGAIMAGGFVALFILAMSFLTWHANLAVSLPIHGSLAAVVLLLMLLNLRAGGTCLVKVQTAVSEETLTSLYRTRVAYRVLDSLRPLIAERQASLAAAPAAPAVPAEAGSAAAPGTGAAEAMPAAAEAAPPGSLSAPAAEPPAATA